MNTVPTMHPTPGPWIVCKRNDIMTNNQTVENVITVEKPSNDPNKVHIVALCGYQGTEGEEEALANAALIAVAPDMLEVLIAIQESCINAINGKIDANVCAVMISGIFDKLLNEAGVE